MKTSTASTVAIFCLLLSVNSASQLDDEGKLGLKHDERVLKHISENKPLPSSVEGKYTWPILTAIKRRLNQKYLNNLLPMDTLDISYESNSLPPMIAKDYKEQKAKLVNLLYHKLAGEAHWEALLDLAIKLDFL